MYLPPDGPATLAAVVDAGSLEAAAVRLRVTASAVSQRVKALERAVGRVLLVRSRPARATEAGEIVVRLARQQSLLADQALTALGAAPDVVTPTVSLAVNADSLSTWFLAPLAAIAARRPVVFDLHRDDQDHTARLLESGTVMAAVTSRADPVAGCRVVALGAMRYEAVATPALARRWADTPADVPVVVFDRRDELQDHALRAAGLDAASVARHHIPSSHDFAAAVRAGLGWGMLPEAQSAAGLASGGLVRLPGAPIDVALFWQQWDLRSDLLDAVAEAVIAATTGALRPGRPGRAAPARGIRPPAQE